MSEIIYCCDPKSVLVEARQGMFSVRMGGAGNVPGKLHVQDAAWPLKLSRTILPPHLRSTSFPGWILEEAFFSRYDSVLQALDSLLRSTSLMNATICVVDECWFEEKVVGSSMDHEVVKTQSLL